MQRKGEDKRDVRRSYYGHLGLDVEPDVSVFDEILNSQFVDVPLLRELCGKYTIPGKLRAQIWKILLGVLPPFREAWGFIDCQLNEQHSDIKHSMAALVKEEINNYNELFDPTMGIDKATLRFRFPDERIEKMTRTITHMYNFKLYLDFPMVRQEVRFKRNNLDIAKVFATVFSDEVDAFWAYRSFLFTYGSSMRQSTNDFEPQINLVNEMLILFNEALIRTLVQNKVSIQVICTHWFGNYFAEFIPLYVVKRLWDKIIGLTRDFLAYFATALLEKMTPQLMQVTSKDVLCHILLSPPTEDIDLDEVLQKSVFLFQTMKAKI